MEICASRASTSNQRTHHNWRKARDSSRCVRHALSTHSGSTLLTASAASSSARMRPPRVSVSAVRSWVVATRRLSSQTRRLLPKRKPPRGTASMRCHCPVCSGTCRPRCTIWILFRRLISQIPARSLWPSAILASSKSIAESPSWHYRPLS